MASIGKTYKIIDLKDDGCLNHVTQAPTERDSDDIPVREAKRREHAEALAGRWSQTMFTDTTLRVVEA